MLVSHRPGSEPLSSRPATDSAPPPSPAPITSTSSTTDAGSLASQRFKVRVPSGQCVVARYHGRFGRDTALILPDGQLGVTNRLIPTEQPFQPLTSEQLQTVLLEGPFADYHLLKTDHYLIFYKSSIAFAQDSGRLLEDLYRGMIDTFRRNEIPVHESEFPLVAVIFATERDFRDHKQVDPQVQAYYEFFTNRIFFYQKSDRDKLEPKVAALLKPQTVAARGRPPDPLQYRRPTSSQLLAALVDRRTGRVFRHHGQLQERNHVERNGRDQLAAHGHDPRARGPAFEPGQRRHRAGGAGLRGTGRPCRPSR